MIGVSIFVPQHDNDGVEFAKEDFDEFCSVACDLFGGYSYLGPASGGWKDENRKLYLDRHANYEVCVSSIKDFAKVLTLAEFVKEKFKQQAVFVRFLGQAEII